MASSAGRFDVQWMIWILALVGTQYQFYQRGELTISIKSWQFCWFGSKPELCLINALFSFLMKEEDWIKHQITLTNCPNYLQIQINIKFNCLRVNRTFVKVSSLKSDSNKEYFSFLTPINLVSAINRVKNQVLN